MFTSKASGCFEGEFYHFSYGRHPYLIADRCFTIPRIQSVEAVPSLSLALPLCACAVALRRPELLRRARSRLFVRRRSPFSDTLGARADYGVSLHQGEDLIAMQGFSHDYSLRECFSMQAALAVVYFTLAFLVEGLADWGSTAHIRCDASWSVVFV